MRSLPVRARIVVSTISLAGGAVWAWLLSQLQPTDPGTSALAAMLFLSAVATEYLSVPLRRGVVISISTIVHIAAILLLPLPVVATLAGGAVAIEQSSKQKPWFKTTFNTGSVVLTVSVVALASRVLGNPIERASTQPVLSLISLFVIAATYQLMTSGIMGLLLWQITGRPVHRYILNSRSAVPELATGLLGSLLAFVWYHAPLWTIVMLFPAAIAYLIFRYIHRVVNETDLAVETMARIVDERDHYTYMHSSHVAEYTELIARAMLLDADEIEVIVSAARVHDLGKIGIGNRSLYKDGVLDAREQAEMQSHPVIGARILGHFESYREGVKYVLHHHERWDGKGYPHRLRGEEIPLGSRIISVADAFDAMTTDRPYRRALTVEAAIEGIRAGIATYFDPIVAGHFISIEPEIRRRVEERPLPLRVRQAQAETESGMTPAAPSDGPTETSRGRTRPSAQSR